MTNNFTLTLYLALNHDLALCLVPLFSHFLTSIELQLCLCVMQLLFHLCELDPHDLLPHESLLPLPLLE